MQKTRIEPVFLGHEPNRLTVTAFLLFLLGFHSAYYNTENVLIKICDELKKTLLFLLQELKL